LDRVSSFSINKGHPDITTRGRLMTSFIPSCSIRRNFLALILFSAFITACSGIPFYEYQDDLDDAIKYYSNNFEAKLPERSTMFGVRIKKKNS
jgi:hypothetical protein